MTGRHSVTDAVPLLQSELRAATGSSTASPTTDDASRAFFRFARERFDVPDRPDADGLLFQYGTHNFGGPPMFLLDLTRQFEVVQADGEHDYFVQVHCEMRYEPAPELSALGSFDSWFFHDAAEDLDAWVAELIDGHGWEVIRHHSPSVVEVYEEQV